MPFTFAHPAAVLPLPHILRKWTVPSALVIGSMAPDLAFFIPLGVTRLQSHSLAGVLWFCLPIGLIGYAIYHLFLKHPLVSLLPDFISRRLTHIIDSRRFPADTWSAIAVSLIAGALTHLAWDSFTHPGAPGVEAIPFLRMEVFTVDTYHGYVYKLLQYFSSAFGLFVLSLYSYIWLRKAPLGPVPVLSMKNTDRIKSLAVMLALPLISGLGTTLAYFPTPFTVRGIENLLGMGAVSVFSSLGIALLAFASWWHLVKPAFDKN